MSGIVFGIEVTKTGLVKKNMAPGAYQHGNEFQLCHLLAVLPWTSCLVSLRLSFLTCKMRIIIPSS